VKVSAYASRAKHQYCDKCFAQLRELSSHDRSERRVYIDGSGSYWKYFCSRYRRHFVRVAIDNHLMLTSEVETIAAA
jgi:hypothetical protein